MDSHNMFEKLSEISEREGVRFPDNALDAYLYDYAKKTLNHLNGVIEDLHLDMANGQSIMDALNHRPDFNEPIEVKLYTYDDCNDEDVLLQLFPKFLSKEYKAPIKDLLELLAHCKAAQYFYAFFLASMGDERIRNQCFKTPPISMLFQMNFVSMKLNGAAGLCIGYARFIMDPFEKRLKSQKSRKKKASLKKSKVYKFIKSKNSDWFEGRSMSNIAVIIKRATKLDLSTKQIINYIVEGIENKEFEGAKQETILKNLLQISKK